MKAAQGEGGVTQVGSDMIDDDALLADLRFAVRGLEFGPPNVRRRFCKIVGALVLLFFFPVVAIAQTQDEYQTWISTPGAYKLGYVSGVLDAFIHSTPPADHIGTALGKAYQPCIAHHDLQPAALVEMIDLAYKADAQRYRFPPSVILMCELQKECASEVDGELKAAGLNKPSLCPH